MTFVGTDSDAAAAEQLEALGRFAGSVAHDINNMLFGINGFIDLALAQEIDDGAGRHLRSAGATLEHSAEMTRQLLAFSRGQAVELQPLSLSPAVVRLRGCSTSWPAMSA